MLVWENATKNELRIKRLKLIITLKHDSMPREMDINNDWPKINEATTFVAMIAKLNTLLECPIIKTREDD